MKTIRKLRLMVVFVAAWNGHAVLGQQSIVGSPHDLSVSGPGTIRAVNEEQVCIFCHAPHNASGQAPLWNRFERTVHYRIYESPTIDARIDQPSGPSKMCLSCHDGATAIGLVSSRPKTSPIVMTHRTIPPGASDLTDDLADDHPIGFRYDRALANRDRQLKDPEVISRELMLGRHGEVHCTTCHDAHNNQYGDFLRIPDVRSAICTTCHDMTGWHTSVHALSPAATPGRSVNAQEMLQYSTVADNACANCHMIHSAPRAEWLLRFRREEENCLTCHNGGVARTNILSEQRKLSVHPVFRTLDRHEPDEEFRRVRRHVECTDCHNPHAVALSISSVGLRNAGTGAAPVPVSGNTRLVPGVNRAGRAVDHSRYEYEICFKCHADGLRRRPTTNIPRQITQTNTRREFQTANPSFHPVIGPRGNPDVVSLIPPLNVGSTIGCTDCHNSDSIDSGGPSGPHGSIYEPLLVANYSTQDLSSESPSSYALCYRCHDRESILGDESFSLHRQHVVNERTPCSACHDAHGISRTQGSSTNHSNLINFDLSIVSPVSGGIQSRLVFEDLGLRRGSCTLTCHGVVHVSFEYGR